MRLTCFWEGFALVASTPRIRLMPDFRKNFEAPYYENIVHTSTMLCIKELLELGVDAGVTSRVED